MKIDINAALEENNELKAKCNALYSELKAANDEIDRLLTELDCLDETIRNAINDLANGRSQR